MLAQSPAQQRAAELALAVKRGDAPETSLDPLARDLYDHLTVSELEELAWPLAA